jgi:hypothetical protein
MKSVFLGREGLAGSETRFAGGDLASVTAQPPLYIYFFPLRYKSNTRNYTHYPGTVWKVYKMAGFHGEKAKKVRVVVRVMRWV